MLKYDDGQMRPNECAYKSREAALRKARVAVRGCTASLRSSARRLNAIDAERADCHTDDDPEDLLVRWAGREQRAMAPVSAQGRRDRGSH